MPTSIKTLFSDARAAQGIRAHTPKGFSEPTHMLTTPKMRGTILSLCEPVPNIAAYFDDQGKLRRVPKGRPASTPVSIDPLTVARAHSRFAAAGVNLLLRAPPLTPQPVGQQGVVVMQRELSGMSVIQPLPMNVVADDADTPVVVSLPVKSASVDWSDENSTPAYAVQLEIPRGDYRDRLHDGSLDQVLTVAILAGAGRIADHALMTALAAASLTEFSLAAAASSGLAFGELRAMVGTAGNGATVGQDGALRASGIAAELTDTGLHTFVGAFDHAAVLLDSEIRVFAEKTSLDGALTVTVLASAAALLPDKSKFWRVAP
jgi:hypothetical protein